ncbi:hypothetical protein J1N35_044727 [Gossypium stocksii]|uniref:RNase H type-1 domain-containing protein n=1 Tax=Gossypium stocksii TaxID=47602 RepID=A0A9D3UA18_9ROSI|nr:hypothetical protein J1N35_044727 [Gossypium stocksii]
MTNNASCLACGNALESTSHLFHDCIILKEIWSGLQGSWKNRNKRVFQGIEPQASSVLAVRINLQKRLGSRGFAVAGGSIQNESAEWIKELGIRRLIVEIDALLVVNYLNKQHAAEHPLNTLTMNCWQLINEGWVMEIRHVFSCAHHSANLAHALEEDGVTLESP